MYFAYGEQETAYLKQRDPLLGQIIDQVGHIYRQTDPDLFSAVVHHIIGQQISTKAQDTIWQRMQTAFADITASKIAAVSIEELQSFGITFRKAAYIKDFACQVVTGSFNIEELKDKPDAEVIADLTSLKGIGVWTAEMILLFCLERADIFSYDDLALQRGLRMLYHHRKIDRKLFEKYRRRFSPYGSVASLYLWAVAGNAVAGLKDYAPTGKGVANGKSRKNNRGKKQG